MKIEDVIILEPMEQFLYWIRERHLIHLRRAAKQKKPWTDDEVMQQFFFTNPYRENDKTTTWFANKVREPWRNQERVLFATICFRWFNYIPTGEIFIKEGLLDNWDPERCKAAVAGQPKVFTGAFMINSPPRMRKIDAITQRVTNVWNAREKLIEAAKTWKTMKEACTYLQQFPGLGGFMAYEVVCDWRYTKWLEKARDKLIWANPGPGCIRGLYRVAGLPLVKKRRTGKISNSSSPPKPKDWLEQMIKIRETVNTWIQKNKYFDMPYFEMREVEHSLCEVDKYMRMLQQDGHSKRIFDGTGY
jgi:hypothetical protein